MRLPELSNAGAFPTVPSFDRRNRSSRRIGFKYRDTVAIASKHGRRTQPNCSSAADYNFAHLYPRVCGSMLTLFCFAAACKVSADARLEMRPTRWSYGQQAALNSRPVQKEWGEGGQEYPLEIIG
jgi:hypothetical protein